jgi:hypothetical protein
MSMSFITRHIAFVVFLPSVLLLAACNAEPNASAAAEEADRVSLRELTGAPARAVWVQDRGAGDDLHQKGNNHALMAYDTETGRTRTLWAPGDQIKRPMLSPDGTYVVFSRWRDGTIFRIPFEGGTPQRLGTGTALDLWRDPATGRDWLYAAVVRSKNPDAPYRRMVRFPVDDPRRVEELWRRGDVSTDSVQVSRDGSRIGGMFPWPKGMVLNTRDGSVAQLGRGCWSSLAPDNSYLFWTFDGAHRNVFIHTEDGAERWRVPVNTIPGGAGRKMYHPRWSNHARFMALSGPYDTEGGRLSARKAAPGVEIWVGRFDERMERIEAWAQVTDNAVGDYTPDLWVAGGESYSVERTDRSPQAAAPAPSMGEQWPGTEEGLVFRWSHANTRNVVPGPAGGDAIECDVTPIGGGRLTLAYALDIRNGSYVAPDAGARIVAACKASNEVSIEATLRPRGVAVHGPARIIALSQRIGNANFVVGQERDRLVFRLRTPDSGADGSANDSQVDLGPVVAGQLTHLIVSYRDGELAVYRDGRAVRVPQQLRGGFADWEMAELRLGDESSRDRTWDGELDGIAISSRFIGPEEARRRHELNRARVGDRREPDTTRLRARAVEATAVPSLAEIAPYRRALALAVYELDPAHPPIDGSRNVQVYHWVILDGEPMPGAMPKPGEWRDLVLQRSEAHPQLEAERRLVGTDAFDLPEFIDVGR